jgi:hypothetical protein
LKSFRKIRDEAYIREIFDRYATKSTSTVESALDASTIGKVLQDLGISGNGTGEILGMVLHQDGRVDFEEFLSACSIPSAAEAWAKRGAWCEIVAGCMPQASDKKGDSALRCIAALSDEDVDIAWQVIAEEMKIEFRSRILELRHSFGEMDRASADSKLGGASAKFQTFKASAGTVDDFHKGLSGRVGMNGIFQNIDNECSVFDA